MKEKNKKIILKNYDESIHTEEYEKAKIAIQPTKMRSEPVNK